MLSLLTKLCINLSLYRKYDIKKLTVLNAKKMSTGFALSAAVPSAKQHFLSKKGLTWTAPETRSGVRCTRFTLWGAAKACQGPLPTTTLQWQLFSPDGRTGDKLLPLPSSPGENLPAQAASPPSPGAGSTQGHLCATARGAAPPPPAASRRRRFHSGGAGSDVPPSPPAPAGSPGSWQRPAGPPARRAAPPSAARRREAGGPWGGRGAARTHLPSPWQRPPRGWGAAPGPRPARRPPAPGRAPAAARTAGTPRSRPEPPPPPPSPAPAATASAPPPRPRRRPTAAAPAARRARGPSGGATAGRCAERPWPPLRPSDRRTEPPGLPAEASREAAKGWGSQRPLQSPPRATCPAAAAVAAGRPARPPPRLRRPPACPRSPLARLQAPAQRRRAAAPRRWPRGAPVSRDRQQQAAAGSVPAAGCSQVSGGTRWLGQMRRTGTDLSPGGLSRSACLGRATRGNCRDGTGLACGPRCGLAGGPRALGAEPCLFAALLPRNGARVTQQRIFAEIWKR